MISQSVSGRFSLSLNGRDYCSLAKQSAFLHNRCRDLLQTISLRPKSLFYSWCFNEMAGLSYLLQLVWMILRLFSYPCRQPNPGASIVSIQQSQNFVNRLFWNLYFLFVFSCFEWDFCFRRLQIHAIYVLFITFSRSPDGTDHRQTPQRSHRQGQPVFQKRLHEVYWAERKGCGVRETGKK